MFLCNVSVFNLILLWRLVEFMFLWMSGLLTKEKDGGWSRWWWKHSWRLGVNNEIEKKLQKLVPQVAKRGGKKQSRGEQWFWILRVWTEEGCGGPHAPCRYLGSRPERRVEVDRFWFSWRQADRLRTVWRRGSFTQLLMHGVYASHRATHNHDDVVRNTELTFLQPKIITQNATALVSFIFPFCLKHLHLK